MMDDLISRSAAIEAIKPLLYSGNCVSTLINMPAVDAVPVVRCKDCKHSDAWYGDKRICRLWNDKDGHNVFEDGFCSYGERREPMDDGVITPIEEKMPHKVSEVICIKCCKRWIAVRPITVWLKDLECANCGHGYVIETGQELDGEDKT